MQHSTEVEPAQPESWEVQVDHEKGTVQLGGSAHEKFLRRNEIRGGFKDVGLLLVMVGMGELVYNLPLPWWMMICATILAFMLLEPLSISVMKLAELIWPVTDEPPAPSVYHSRFVVALMDAVLDGRDRLGFNPADLVAGVDKLFDRDRAGRTPSQRSQLSTKDAWLFDLLKDPEFREDTLEVIYMVAATDNPATFATARRAVRQLRNTQRRRARQLRHTAASRELAQKRREEAQARELAAAQPDYSEELKDVVRRNTMLVAALTEVETGRW